MIKQEKWPNGLRTIYIPMKNTKTVTIMVLVGTGSRHETKDINGISHFLEHMFFKGTTKRPDKKAIAQELDSVGANYNAFTSKEYTGYWVKTDNKHTKLAIDVVSDMFLNSTVPAEEIEKERSVILGEKDMREDIPMHMVGIVFEELLYGDQPIGWDIIGTKKAIKSIQREDFIKYMNQHYRSRNTVIILAGNFELKKGKKLIKEYFGNIKNGSSPKPLPVKERQKTPQIKIINKKTDQTHLVLGTRAFDMNDKRRWALSLLGVILGGNMSSRLFIKIRDVLGLGYYISAGADLSTDHGYFEVNAGVDNKRVIPAIEAIMEELREVKKNGVSETELKNAKDYIRGTTVMGLESSSSLADFYGFQELLTQKILTPEEKFRMLDKVEVSDIRKVAKDIFKSNRLNLALIGPAQNKRELRKVLKF